MFFTLSALQLLHVTVWSSPGGTGKYIRNRRENFKRKHQLCKQQIPPFLLFLAVGQLGQSEGALRTQSRDTVAVSEAPRKLNKATSTHQK